jgi:hypothetical protein
MSHRVNDEIGLALARRIAEQLPSRPDWIQLAKNNLARWSKLNADSRSLLRCYHEWQEILDRPLDEVISVLLSETDEGQRLRQNSPFAGTLTPQEVWQIKQRVRHDQTPA